MPSDIELLPRASLKQFLSLTRRMTTDEWTQALMRDPFLLRNADDCMAVLTRVFEGKDAYKAKASSTIPPGISEIC